MAVITVQSESGDRYLVVVKDGAGSSQHRVTVSPGYHQALTGGTISAEALVRRSFEFLLDREPNTSILQTFDLKVIGTYFPEYEETIGKQAS